MHFLHGLLLLADCGRSREHSTWQIVNRRRAPVSLRAIIVVPGVLKNICGYMHSVVIVVTFVPDWVSMATI